MRVYAGMDPRLPLARVGPYAARVEDLGYDGLHVAEMIHDPYVASALALQSTSSLLVRTGVALAFVRSPMATAMTAWELAHLSQGRFDLGLGTQVRANIEERFGMAFDRPVARMRDHVGAVRAGFEAFETGGELTHLGPFHRLTRLQPDFRPEPLGSIRRPEVWMGAVGTQLVSLAGEVADGLLTHPTNSHPIDLADRVLPSLANGAQRAGRETPPVVASPMVVTGADAGAMVRARDPIRRRLAFLYSTPAYEPTLTLLGLGELGPSLRALTRSREWDRLADLLPDEVLDRLVVVAPWPDLCDSLRSRYGEAVSGVMVRPPDDPSSDDRFRGVIAALQRA